MLKKALHYIQGYLKIGVFGYSPERFLNLCRNKGIQLWDLLPQNDHYELFIKVSDFRKLKPILRKTGTKVSILERFGLPFFLNKYRKRKILFAGIFFCIAIILLLSQFVWDVKIEGNQMVTDEVIIEFLEAKNNSNWMLLRKVDCPKIERDLRKRFEEIIWVSVSVKGTKILIEIRENHNMKLEEEQTKKATDIVATSNGVVTKIITRKGVPLVKKGDVVKKGDILVSGSVPVFNDAGEVINYQYQTADADILAERTVVYYDEEALTYRKKEYTKSKRNNYYIRTSNWLCVLGLPQNSYEQAEQFSSENKVRIGPLFSFPITYGKRSVYEYQWKEHTYRKTELQNILSASFYTYCNKIEEEGKTIKNKDVKIYMSSTKAVAKGTLKIIEDIGKQKVINIDFNNDSVIEY